MTLDAINPDIAQNATTVSEGEIKTITRHEAAEVTKLQDARTKQTSAASSEGTAADIGKVPDLSINVQPWGIGLSTTIGGTYVAKFPNRMHAPIVPTLAHPISHADLQTAVRTLKLSFLIDL